MAIKYEPDSAGMARLARSEPVGQAMLAAAGRGAAAVPGGRAHRADVTVLGRWGGQRAGAVVESDEASVRDLVRAAEVVERGA